MKITHEWMSVRVQVALHFDFLPAPSLHVSEDIVPANGAVGSVG